MQGYYTPYGNHRVKGTHHEGLEILVAQIQVGFRTPCHYEILAITEYTFQQGAHMNRQCALMEMPAQLFIWVRFISVETRNGGRVAAVFAAYRDPKAVVSTLAPGTARDLLSKSRAVPGSAGVRRLGNVAYSTTCSNSNETHPFSFGPVMACIVPLFEVFGKGLVWPSDLPTF